jgi:hypothetical protein
MSCHAANIAVVIAMIRGMSLSKQITVEHCLIHAPLILQHGKLVRCRICSFWLQARSLRCVTDNRSSLPSPADTLPATVHYYGAQKSKFIMNTNPQVF